MRMSEPMVRMACDECGRHYDQQVGRNRTRKEVERIDDERPHRCAECARFDAAYGEAGNE